MNQLYQCREPRRMKQGNEGQVDRLDDTLGLEAAARMIRLGLDVMKELVDKGEIPAVRLNQKHNVMLREDLINFLRTEGWRQAAERKKSSAVKQHIENNTKRAPRPVAGKQRRATLLDLRAYEQMTSES
ncbi:hypothetical protein [Stenotrophomonas maltophilia]|uniref:hypothetical protein n=1 Tax=Stenotrophomonas maltophilia TaxID=40324 RepID=UPI0011B5382F|nr:hypothetical protein [Stenotrophomonas maltophilia]